MTTPSAAAGSARAPRRVVLVGGGHAHVHVLEGFAERPPEDCRLVVVADTPIAVYSGMVPGLVAGRYRAGDLQIDVRPLARRAGAEVIVARAVRIDADARAIHVEDGPPVPYDVASINIGSTVAGLDLPGIRAHALPTRPIGVFVERVDELAARARAHAPPDPFEVLVVGGGAGGVELAFTLETRLARECRAPVRVMLLERGDRILAGYPRSLGRRVERRAAARGIEIALRQAVASADAESVTLDDGRRQACHALVWVTGAVSHPLFRDSGLDVDRRGFLHVRSTLQAKDHDDLLAVGDCATLIDHPNTPKAGVYSVRQGPLVTDNIRARLAGRPLASYRPQRDFLTLLNLGDGTALGAKWGRSFAGRWVMTLKDRIDRRFMRRFQMPDPVP
ncbi:MAG: FAD-dependent oxidoreductase [Planctomycetota bacterium]